VEVPWALNLPKIVKHSESTRREEISNSKTTRNAAHATASNPHAMAQRRAWQASRAEQELVRNRASSFGGSAFATPEFARRRPDLNDAGASRGPQLHISPADHRSGTFQMLISRIDIDIAAVVHTRAARYSVLNRGEPPIPHRRRTAHGAWSSDDDEDAVPEMNAEESYRRSAELLFSPEDEERSMWHFLCFTSLGISELLRQP
jgi:hypothetical protein